MTAITRTYESFPDLIEKQIDEKIAYVDMLAIRLYGMVLETKSDAELMRLPATPRRYMRTLDNDSNESSVDETQSDDEESDSIDEAPEPIQQTVAAKVEEVFLEPVTAAVSTVSISSRNLYPITNLPAVPATMIEVDQYHGFGYQTTKIYIVE